jgi:hypothetical protein
MASGKKEYFQQAREQRYFEFQWQVGTETTIEGVRAKEGREEAPENELDKIISSSKQARNPCGQEKSRVKHKSAHKSTNKSTNK